ncbi:hypothetical protein Bbelb_258900 [Branchiostoma belcheri]|nr:hypothetical protein Bbelb_258900 [Branchiostoma belcheri]
METGGPAGVLHPPPSNSFQAVPGNSSRTRSKILAVPGNSCRTRENFKPYPRLRHEFPGTARIFERAYEVTGTLPVPSLPWNGQAVLGALGNLLECRPPVVGFAAVGVQSQPCRTPAEFEVTPGGEEFLVWSLKDSQFNPQQDRIPDCEVTSYSV